MFESDLKCHWYSVVINKILNKRLPISLGFILFMFISGYEINLLFLSIISLKH